MRPIGIVILLALILFLLITHVIGDQKLIKNGRFKVNWYAWRLLYRALYL